jgi:hypothetical protein
VRIALAGMLSYALMVPSLTLSAEAADETEELEEVNVTGTRIQAPGNNTSANPMTTVTAEEMRQQGIVNVGDALLQLVPQNISTYQPGLIGDSQSGSGGSGMDTLDRSSFFIGNTIANLRGMDPAFGTRTLTLVDGRRMVSTSNQADVVDLNIIPSNLLSRMDVVTGGASATYGSGAMAGVVNLVLNNRLTGFNLDMDYGLNEAGDGGSPHISMSGGLPLFGGRAHALLGVEWQKQQPILSCATAREWCAESRVLFNNSSASTTNPAQVRTALPGFETYPRQFMMTDQRYSQWAPTSTVYHNSTTNTSGYRFNAEGTDIEEYAYGYRGGTGTSTIGGDGPSLSQPGGSPLTTQFTPMRPESDRKTLFGNFEFNLTERTTAYLQTNYAKTEGRNRLAPQNGNYCVRWDTQGAAGNNALAGTVIYFTSIQANLGTVNGELYPDGTVVGLRDGRLNPINAALAALLGLDQMNSSNPSGANPTAATAPLPGSGSNPGPVVGTRLGGSYSNGNGVGPNNTPFYATQLVQVGTTNISNSRGVAFPFWMPVALSPAPPNFDFNGNGIGKWVRFRFNDADYNTGTGPNGTAYTNPHYPNDYWLLESITLINGFDTGTATTIPVVSNVGRSNAYAFLNTLTPSAQALLQKEFGKSNTAGGGAGVDTFYGQNPCLGFTAMRKIWNPQINQWSSNESETMRVVAGVKGRFGRDWRWDASATYGSTDSSSSSNDVATTIRLAFAMDAVVDDRPTLADGSPNPTYLQPVCRVNRDGAPILDTSGRPLSNPEGLAALANGCRPINIFGNSYASTSSVFGNNYDPAATQQQAIDYAFVETTSSGTVTQKTLTLSANGTLWQGWGAGPLTSAFGVEVREDATDNKGSVGDFYVRADLSRSWQDAYGGKTTTTEPYAEFNMPLVSGVPGVNLWSANLGLRYSSQKNEGGAGTTGERSTQNLFIWKGQTVFEPFDWVRLRLSRSRDLRAATYRDLFLYNPAIPDSQLVINPWRDRTPTSTENQQDRYGQVRVGNPNLKPETSDTLTVGLVLSPGGWAQGMRISIDYSNIQVKNAIGTSFRAANPVTECFNESGNVAGQYSGEDGSLLNPDEAINTLFDPSNPACQDLLFADAGPDGRPYQDLISFNASRPSNSLPVQRRDINLSLQYLFPLSRAFEALPGSVSITVRAVRALEASGVQQNSSAQGFYVPGTLGITNIRLPNPDACGARYDAADPENSRPAFGVRVNGFQNGLNFPTGFYSNRYTCVDGVGQIRMDPFISGVAASPKWSGSASLAYIVNDLTATLAARYTSGAVINRNYGDSPDDPNYQNVNGAFLNGSIDNNWIKPYVNFSLNGSYRLKVADLKQVEVFGSINNLFNKSPPFAGSSGSSAGPGVDLLGRAYRMGVRLKF